MTQGRFVIPFSQLRMTDVDIVGGKNASLGELLSQLTEAGIRVPDGFATTAEAFRVFLKEGGLDKRIEDRLSKLDVDDVKELAKAGAEIREWIEKAPFPAQLEKEIREHYEWLKGDQKEISVAVRSSATAEDLPDASFAGPAGNLPERRRSRTSVRKNEGSIRFSLQRPCDLLPRSQRL